MEQPPPLTPQEISEITGSEYTQLGQPQVVKVLGIMHLVFGGIGALGATWGLLIAIIGNPFLNMMSGTPQMKAQIDAQATMQSEMLPVTICSSVLSIIITALIITAGIQLLKMRKNAVKWSNRYAYASIVGKVINLVLSLSFILPMTQKMVSEMSPSSSHVLLPMNSVMMGSMIFTAVISCVYPILSLILLNRPNVKAWFANKPE